LYRGIVSQQLHHEERDVILLADVVQRTDVRVIQPGHHTRFALQPLESVVR
jgi:hypothetical protein